MDQFVPGADLRSYAFRSIELDLGKRRRDSSDSHRMVTKLFMGDLEDDGTVDSSGKSDKDGLQVQNHPAERIELKLERFGQHECLLWDCDRVPSA